jgi:DNA-binding SARP family transcriptional activator/TolB-like protein
MLLLCTLGSIALVEHTPSGPRHVDIQQKRLALLVFLACGGRGHFVRRDLLLSYFWPETDEHHGRAVLRQALTAFRKQLGAGVLVTRGEDEIGLAPGGLACDASEFEGACRAGAYEDACVRYHGHFLAGFHAKGIAPEFEQWVDAERDRLRRLACDGMWRLAMQLEASGEAQDAMSWARRAVGMQPEDEPGVVRLISLLDRQGDRSGALTAYAALERRLADEFAAQPGPETRALMQVILQLPTPAPPRAAERDASQLVAESLVIGTDLGVDGAIASDSPSPRRHETRFRGPSLVAGVVGALAVVVLLVLVGLARPGQPTSVRRLAVLPFRVHASDSAMSWLREGMVEMLSMRLAGTEALDVVEPGRALAAWRSASPNASADASADLLRRVAHQAEATRIVQGSISGTAEHVVLTAWVLAMPSGRLDAQAEVEGPPDSLPLLVDRLSAKLFGLTSGVEGHRLASLEGVPLSAIRAFLAGRAAVRRGHPEEATARFREALAHDTTFALAALDLRRAAGWTKVDADIALGARVVRVHRDRLSPPDRALHDVSEEQWLSAPDMFGKWHAAVSAYPELPETWYGLGDSYFHWGMLAGIDDPLGKAEHAFRRGWALDSAAGDAALPTPLIAETMDHLVVLAHLRADTAEVLRLTALVLAKDSSSDLAVKLRWHRAVVQGGQARTDAWSRLGQSARPIMGVVLFTLWASVAADDHARAVRELQRTLQSRDPGLRTFALRFEAFNSGRPGDAPRSSDAGNALRRSLLDADSWGGDSTAANEAARTLSRSADGSPLQGNGARMQYWDICRLGLWRAARGNAPAAEIAARQLRNGHRPVLPPRDSAGFAHFTELCAALLDAEAAVIRREPGAGAAVAVADSLARTYIIEVCCGEAVEDANLVLARLWERQGHTHAALRAVRRRTGGFLLGPLFLSTYLREEGRLATLTGDTTGAARAYRHYLALRPDPEPVARAEVRLVEQRLAALGLRTSVTRASRPLP